MREAAKRVVNTKFVNSGQTCMAPDYVLCADKWHEAFLEALLDEVKAAYGTQPKLAEAGLARLCQGSQYARVISLLDSAKQSSACKVYQLGSDPPDPKERYVPPTMIDVQGVFFLLSLDSISPICQSPFFPYLTFEFSSDVAEMSSPLLTEEIFGPLLPVVKVKGLEEAIATFRRIDPSPLAVYVFGSRHAAEEVPVKPPPPP